MKRLFSTAIFFVATMVTLFAQQPPQGAAKQGGAAGAGFKMPNLGRVYGKIIESTTKEPAAYASVIVIQTIGKRDTVVGGGLTIDNGDFNIENLPTGKLKVKYSYLGFTPKEQFVVIAPPDNLDQDLGDIMLEPDVKVLNEVTVTAEKSAVQMGIDRKIVNVDKNLSAVGGTAEDVLKTVPSVSIDGDGNATLRNNATQIYVDGRPTSLSLNQIPADQIEQVEIITNPSAKFDANTTGGILNIVMKKNTKPGYNGVLSLGGGTNDRLNAMLNLNVKINKFNFTGIYSYNQASNDPAGYTNRTTFDSNKNIINSFKQTNLQDFGNKFQFGRLGIDYYLNNRNTLTLSQNYVMGAFNIDETQDFKFFDPNDAITQQGLRTVTVRNKFQRYEPSFAWKRTYAKKGKELVLDAQVNTLRPMPRSDFYVINRRADGSLESEQYQRNVGGNKTDGGQLQFDMTNPLNDSTKFEWGLKTTYRDNQSGLGVDTAGSNRVYAPSEILSSSYRIKEMINAAYVTYTGKTKSQIGYQAGLRVETSQFNGTELKENRSFSYYYPAQNGSGLLKSLFPSLYLSKKINEASEMQLNFARKINRPGFMQVVPIIMFSDRTNIRIGNPELRPEFINSAEFNYNTIFGNNSWLTSVYVRNTEDQIVNFARPEDSTDANNPTLINTFINIDNSTSFGWDNTLKLQLVKNLELTLSANVFQVNLAYRGQSVSGFSANTKANLNWKLPKDFSVQVSGNYESPRILPQGRTLDMYFVDFGIKKDFFKIMSLTAGVNDVFNTRRMGNTVETAFLSQELSRRRETRFAKIGLLVRFGKLDANFMKSMMKQGKKGKEQQGGGGEGQEF